MPLHSAEENREVGTPGPKEYARGIASFLALGGTADSVESELIALLVTRWDSLNASEGGSGISDQSSTPDSKAFPAAADVLAAAWTLETLSPRAVLRALHHLLKPRQEVAERSFGVALRSAFLQRLKVPIRIGFHHECKKLGFETAIDEARSLMADAETDFLRWLECSFDDKRVYRLRRSLDDEMKKRRQLSDVEQGDILSTVENSSNAAKMWEWLEVEKFPNILGPLVREYWSSATHAHDLAEYRVLDRYRHLTERDAHPLAPEYLFPKSPRDLVARAEESQSLQEIILHCVEKLTPALRQGWALAMWKEFESEETFTPLYQAVCRQLATDELSAEEIKEAVSRLCEDEGNLWKLHGTEIRGPRSDLLEEALAGRITASNINTSYSRARVKVNACIEKSVENI